MRVALVDRHLHDLLDKDILTPLNGTSLENYVQPASIDIPLGDTAYLVKEKFIPFQRDVQYIVDKWCLEKLDLRQGANFYKGQTYLIPCFDVNLPEDKKIEISPKSSIGRIDLFTQSVFDNHWAFDEVSAGSKGKLWLQVTPQSFHVHVKTGISLSQLMIFENNLFSDDDLTNHTLAYDSVGNVLPNLWYEKNKLLLSLSIKPDSIFGYEALPSSGIIDLTIEDELDASNFFRPLKINKKGRYTIEKDRFYILQTSEKVSIPTQYSAEMIPFSHKIGELRAHYAGFFDPGFGYGENGELFGSSGVLEVRPHETLTVFDKQPICILEYYKNKAVPISSYGTKSNGNHYQGQDKPKLSKYFKDTD